MTARDKPGVSRIFLIGPRGSGKTTVARLVAERLIWSWIDADDAIEQRHGKTVQGLFAEGGEAGFRDKESAVLADLARLDPQVIATGGGVVVRPENRALLQCSGWCVWLTADAATLWRRLQDDPATAQRRPALAGGGFEEVAEILKVRTDLYRTCAHCTVSTDGLPPLEVASAIMDLWHKVGAACD